MTSVKKGLLNAVLGAGLMVGLMALAVASRVDG